MSSRKSLNLSLQQTQNEFYFPTAHLIELEKFPTKIILCTSDTDRYSSNKSAYYEPGNFR